MEPHGDRMAEGGPPRVAVLILNWNGKHDTLETLESVRGLTYDNFEVLLVDNGSTDMSRETVSAQFPEVHIISSPTNLGVAGGRNLGLKAILERSDIEYVLFLDNDVTLEPRLLDKLVAAAESQADLGIIGPTIYYSSDPRRIWSAGVSIVFRDVPAKKVARSPLSWEKGGTVIERVECITGCCMLMKRQVFTSVGRFNPKYFMVCDETDFCYRAARQGIANAVLPGAKVWHKISSSTGGGYTPPRAYFTGRSTILFLKEHGRPWHWVTTFVFAALGLVVAYLRERLQGNQRAVVMKYRGYRDALLERPVDSEVAGYFQSSGSGACLERQRPGEALGHRSS